MLECIKFSCCCCLDDGDTEPTEATDGDKEGAGNGEIIEEERDT